jgi:folate-binding protein YgfZ
MRRLGDTATARSYNQGVTTGASIELDGQYRLLREEAGLVTRPSRGMLRVGGAEAAEFLQGQLTNDVEALTAGAGCYSALLDRKGHMQADMRVLRIDDGEFWIDTEAGASPAVLQHLNTYRIGRQVEMDDVSEEWALLSVVGPAAHEAAGAGPLGPEHAHTELAVRGTTCRAIATELGLDLICPAPDVAALALALGLPEASEDAAEILRVEAGRPRFGREMSAKTIPEEAGINERAVSFSKGCYIGQETVARLHYRGRPNRHLRGLRLEGAAVSGDRIMLGDREVGEVGTGVVSPALGPIALAILRREAEPGTTVEVGDAAVAAEVVELPFR